MSKPIDQYHLKMLELILMDNRILENLKVDGVQVSKIKIAEDGSILMGKYKHGWINGLFNAYYQIGFFEVVQRIAFIITGGKNINRDRDSLAGFIKEAIDKILDKDEKEKVIELLLHYSTLLSKDSPLKLTYDIEKDDPGFNENKGKTRRPKVVGGVADGVLNFGYEAIPVRLNFDIE